MSRNQILLIAIGGVLIVFGIPLTLYLVSQQQDTRSRASEVTYPDSVAFSSQQPTQPPAQTQQTCETPTSPTNTDISYPHVSGEIVDLEQADCTWSGVPEAANYNIKVTDVDTGEVINDDQLPSTTTAYVFQVTQGHTYLCETSAVSDCGAVSAVSSDQQVCETEAFISPSPTEAPQVTSTPAPSPTQGTPPTASPSAPVKPPPPATGTSDVLIIGGGVAAAIVAFGAVLFLL